ncbi:MAG TPA: O-methyltransferase [Candidatus Acidoferrum sp.]|nr:O-methyltransferase [Candidatus Acidoferrum sp.]
MPGILNANVEKYMNQLLPERDDVMREMEEYAAKHKIPIIGPACGRLLYLVTQLSGAKRIFEMGSAIGYSTLWFARATGESGEVFYTDSDPKNAQRARGYFERAGVTERIRQLTGDAIESFEKTPGEFDLILIDIDKQGYPKALEKAVPRLKRGGVLVTDNVLWDGKVARAAKDKDTRTIQQFNKTMYGQDELFSVIVPLRDGVAVCRKN